MTSNNKFILNFHERAISLNNSCAVCWESAKTICSKCNIVAYCSSSHMAKHFKTHRTFCAAVQTIAMQAGGYLYGHKDMQNINADEWRQLRVQKMQHIQMILERPLTPNEREFILFPKICSCYETRPDRLQSCPKCEQVWFCRNESHHSNKKHNKWCSQIKLLTLLAKRNACLETIICDIHTHICSEDHPAPVNMTKALKHLLICPKKKTYGDCEKAALSLVATGPLTIFYGLRLCKMTFHKDTFCIHLIGAEPHFELSAVDSWEMFLLHLIPQIKHLKIVMVGPELYVEKLSLHLLRSKRMCATCQHQAKQITFEFSDKLYHQFSTTNVYQTNKPDLICAFNPGLYRSTGFQSQDTWPATIDTILKAKNSLNENVPFITTAYTNYEAPRDLMRIKQFGKLEIVLPPTENPFASLKPDRNFISDEESPLIYKNYYITVTKSM